jgi:hypothetical protein
MTSCVVESFKSYSCFQGIQGMQAMVEERAEERTGEVRTEEPQVHRQTGRQTDRWRQTEGLAVRCADNQIDN